jgi:TolB-like protein
MAIDAGNSKRAVVAILPFQNHSDSGELDYFSLGFTDDLAMDLSRFSSLHVISPHSTRNIQYSDDQSQELIRSLHANFLIEGSFRQHSGRVKIGTRLISTLDGRVLWAERYNEELSEIFHIQDDIVQRLVSTIQKQITSSVLSASYHKKDSNLEAYDYLLRGMTELEKGGLENDNRARKYFESALARDPNFARAYTGLSLSYFNEWSCRLWERWDASMKGAYKYAQKAIDIDPNDYMAHSVLGRVFLYKGEYEKSEHYLRKSLRLNSNDPDTLIQIASCFVYLGYHKESEEFYLKAMQLNPVNEAWYYAYGSFIYFELGSFEKSLELVQKVHLDSVWVDLAAFAAAGYYLLGDLQNMQKYWKHYLEKFKERIMGGIEPIPGQALEWMININPYNCESQLIPFWEYMRDEGAREVVQIESDSAVNKGKDPASVPQASNIFRKGTGLWEMSFEGKSVFLPDVKGYHDLANLLSTPDKEFHCLDLMGNPVKQDDNALMIDHKAKENYKTKIRELLLDIEEAEQMNDSSRLASLQEEYETLVDHLSSAVGLGGKTRKLDSRAERARSAITWRIRSAIKKIEVAHPALSKHLKKSIRTGTFCSYSPEKSVDWSF